MTTTRFLNAAEAAELLRISRKTIYDWVCERRIPFRKHGNRLVFSAFDLEAWSAGTAVGAGLAVRGPRNEPVAAGKPEESP